MGRKEPSLVTDAIDRARTVPTRSDCTHPARLREATTQAWHSAYGDQLAKPAAAIFDFRDGICLSCCAAAQLVLLLGRWLHPRSLVCWRRLGWSCFGLLNLLPARSVPLEGCEIFLRGCLTTNETQPLPPTCSSTSTPNGSRASGSARAHSVKSLASEHMAGRYSGLSWLSPEAACSGARTRGCRVRREVSLFAS